MTDASPDARPQAGARTETPESPTPDVPGRLHGGNPDHPAAHSSGLFGLALGALGVVFGDIGTSPLYSVQTVFAINNNAVAPTVADVYGVVSMIFWSLTLVVSVKYVSFILRADNDGEGGIMALAALVRGVSGATARRAAFALALGVVGASLFSRSTAGASRHRPPDLEALDRRGWQPRSLITPAISVLCVVMLGELT